MNFTYTSQNEIISGIDEVMKTVDKEPENSVLALVHVSGLHLDPESREKFVTMAKHNKPYLKASVVVGLDTVKALVLKTVCFLSGRTNIVVKDTVEEAKEWLIQQE